MSALDDNVHEDDLSRKRGSIYKYGKQNARADYHLQRAKKYLE